MVRDAESSVPSRAVSLRKLRRGVKIGKLRLDYEVAHVGSDRWITLGELFDSRKQASVVLTESSVVTSAPNRLTAREAERLVERSPRPRLRKIAPSPEATLPPDDLVPVDVVSERDLVSDPDLADVALLAGSDASLGEADDDADSQAEIPSPFAADAHVRSTAWLSETSNEPPSVAPLGPPDESMQTTQDSHEPKTSPITFGVSAARRSNAPAFDASESARSTNGASLGVSRVVVTDIHMPFGSMVIFMVKWVLASIPALFILALVLGALAALGATFLTAFAATR